MDPSARKLREFGSPIAAKSNNGQSPDITASPKITRTTPITLKNPKKAVSGLSTRVSSGETSEVSKSRPPDSPHLPFHSRCVSTCWFQERSLPRNRTYVWCSVSWRGW